MEIRRKEQKFHFFFRHHQSTEVEIKRVEGGKTLKNAASSLGSDSTEMKGRSSARKNPTGYISHF